MAFLCEKSLKELRVLELRAELAKRGLNKSGRKDILIERLQKLLLEDMNKLNVSADQNESVVLLVEDINKSQISDDQRKAVEHDKLANTEMQNTADVTNLKDLVKDLTRLVHDKPHGDSSRMADDRPAEREQDLSVEMAEVKLELAMLWDTVNSIQCKVLKTPAFSKSRRRKCYIHLPKHKVHVVKVLAHRLQT